MLYFPYLDPKREKYEKFLTAYGIMRLLLVSFFAFIYVVTLLVALGKPVDMNMVMPIAMSLLFIILGNYLGKIRQNWYVGIKTPWTLDNEEVWNKTHRLGGKLYVTTGFLGILSIILPPTIRFAVVVGGILVSSLWAVVYSYVLFRKIKKA